MEHRPGHREVSGSIPSPGVYGRQPTDVSLSHRCFCPSLKSMNTSSSSVRIKGKKSAGGSQGQEREPSFTDVPSCGHETGSAGAAGRAEVRLLVSSADLGADGRGSNPRTDNEFLVGRRHGCKWASFCLYFHLNAGTMMRTDSEHRRLGYTLCLQEAKESGMTDTKP